MKIHRKLTNFRTKLTKDDHNSKNKNEPDQSRSFQIKTAKLICIHKGVDHKTISNYSPISILPTFGKCIEKLIGTQISVHKNIFSSAIYNWCE